VGIGGDSVAYFDDINSNLLEIETLLLGTQDLCKLLYYSSATQTTPLTMSTITNTKILRMKNLFPLPKAVDSQNEVKAMLNFYFSDSTPQRSNPAFRNIELCFDIIVHLESWFITEGSRAYAISNKIDEMFNDKLYENLAIGTTNFRRWTQTRYGDYYYGFHLVYQFGKDSHAGVCD
jgi:hypothetical protein